MTPLIKTAGYALQQGAVIASDAVGDMIGTSMPYADSQFLQPDYLGKVLTQYSVEELASPVSLASVSALDIRSTSSNCNNVVVQLEYNNKSDLPEQLFIKLPMPDLGTRWFFGVIESWQLESYFCRHVAPHVPLRTPKTYATHSQGTRFFLAQENLHLDPEVQLFTNTEMINGPSLAIVYRCLDAFAQLHACHYGISPKQREKILPLDRHLFLGPKLRHVSRTLNQMGLGPCVKACGDVIPDEVVALYKKTLKNWDTLLDHWFSGPLSLLHGDSHIGNFFISGDDMGMLDFQAVHWGKGIRDVQYFLIDSLPADILASHEQDLVKYYVERRAVHGEPIQFDATWQEYRGFTYHTLMTIVVSIGFGALNEAHGSYMKDVLRRSIAAVERVDYAGWLDQHTE